MLCIWQTYVTQLPSDVMVIHVSWYFANVLWECFVSLIIFFCQVSCNSSTGQSRNGLEAGLRISSVFLGVSPTKTGSSENHRLKRCRWEYDFPPVNCPNRLLQPCLSGRYWSASQGRSASEQLEWKFNPWKDVPSGKWKRGNGKKVPPICTKIAYWKKVDFSFAMWGLPGYIVTSKNWKLWPANPLLMRPFKVALAPKEAGMLGGYWDDLDFRSDGRWRRDIHFG